MQRALLALGLAALSACGEDPSRIMNPGHGAVARVAILPDTLALPPGSTVQLVAVAYDGDGVPISEPYTVTWLSQDTMRLTVTTGGVARGVRLGATTVTAAVDSETGVVTVAVAGARLASVTTGGTHSCGLDTAAGAMCWGLNREGQVGLGTRTFGEFAPLPVAGGETYATVAAGGQHSCALTTTGATRCWGWNLSGQIGDGSTDDRYQPVAAQAPLFLTISTGGQHTCGLTTDSLAYCWGRNLEGQIGDSSRATRLVPTPVAGSRRFRAISAGGRHTCALTGDSTAYCWGYNDWGQLGVGSTDTSLAPVQVSGTLAFTAISAGRFHTCGVAADSTLHCWGSNFTGELGSGVLDGGDSVPRSVGAAGPWQVVSAGGQHTCALTTDGRAFCWGWNSWGQLGDNSITQRLAPRAVAGGARFVSISAGSDHTCAMGQDGLARCWGFGAAGELGTGFGRSSQAPAEVVGQRF